MSHRIGMSIGVGAPAAPVIDSVTAGDAQNTIDFTPTAGCTTNLYWSLTSPVTTASNKLTGVTSPYVHTGRTNGTAYYYAATAVKSGLESVLSNEMSGTPMLYLVDSVGGTWLTALGCNRLSQAWSDPIHRWRRSNDDAESDFGLSGDELDNATADAWVGANSGYLPVIYDQGGVGNDFIDTTAAKQPEVSTAGTTVVGAVAGKFAWLHAAAEKALVSSALLIPAGAFSFVVVIKDEASADNTNRYVLCNGNASGGLGGPPCLQHYNNTTFRLSISDGTKNVVNNSVAIGTWVVVVGVFNGASSILRVNGNEVSGDVGTNPAAAWTMHLGRKTWLGRMALVAVQAGAWDEATRIKAEAAAKLITGVTW